ncbi:Possible two-component regulator [Helicobacter heilmannii]|uniref:response regulator transcription factor n=1 Tax=Helicobacter heilmannii TaxID=35817 RepID=UPI0006A1FE29|nr:response regulator [Helicobacter heilmannii]CRF51841.1 Possible two-component regulator [Helicobacter heilmannii]
MNKVGSVLIIEDEVHLAQSIHSALSSAGYQCQSATSIFHHFKEDYDVILLSSEACVDRCELFVRKMARAVIIIMSSFVSEDRVNRPLKAGAKDYILKPFKMEELLRKITYHRSYQKAIERASMYEKYLDFSTQNCEVDVRADHSFPLILQSHAQIGADMFVLNYARLHDFYLEFFSLKNLEELPKQSKYFKYPERSCITYFTHLEVLSLKDRERFLSTLETQKAIVSFVGQESLDYANLLSLESSQPTLSFNLLSIQDYEKSAIQQFSASYTDTELAKRLGISRKSLWEKRRRYNLPRKSPPQLEV